MNETERLEEIRFFFKKNKTDFANLLGYKYAQNYTAVLAGRTSISIKVINAIKEADERISIDWLLWGQGSMLLPQSSIIDSKTITGDHTQATVTGNISNTNNTTSSTTKHIELLQERIKDKETNIKTLQKLLESKEITISLYQERVTALEKEVQQLQEQIKQ